MAAPTVGLLYDERMCAHATPDGEPHPEKPERLRSIWRKLQLEGITDRCVVMEAKEAEDKYIAYVHSQSHIKLIKTISSKELDSRRHRVARKFNSIYFNKGSSESAYLAAGSAIKVTEKVAKGELSSAIALVRPPGHHAEHNQPMGFCLFNNVAVAANYLLNERPELGIGKILIVDWDVHHGNGTQKTFYDDSRVLFFSVHRFDSGSFYPSGGDGAYCMIGEGPGQGYNINVPWEHGRCGDADYLAVWDHVLLPVAESYNPDIILVSAGFDAAAGDPLGGCSITPHGYALLLEKLKRFAQGKIVLLLEGGYNLNSIANSVLACARALLGDECSSGKLDTKPFESTWRVIQLVRNELKNYWPVFSGKIPEEDMKKPRSISNLKLHWSSDSESDSEEATGACGETLSGADDASRRLSEINIADVTSTSVTSSHETSKASVPWRSVLSKIDVWYASYGSNMWLPRFLCYVSGGKIEGMNNQCCGSLDTSAPKVINWRTVPHRLFFGGTSSRSWGKGGVAFLHPEKNEEERAHVCIYKITLEQFNDILFQENTTMDVSALGKIRSPLIDLPVVDLLLKNKSLIVELPKSSWYSNVVCLGMEDGIPILTFTCKMSDIDSYKSGERVLAPPAKQYASTLIKGLVEGKQLTEDEAMDYINAASCRKL
ncbi:histone deacetylase 5 [Carex rostrata]